MIVYLSTALLCVRLVSGCSVGRPVAACPGTPQQPARRGSHVRRSAGRGRTVRRAGQLLPVHQYSCGPVRRRAPGTELRCRHATTTKRGHRSRRLHRRPARSHDGLVPDRPDRHTRWLRTELVQPAGGHAEPSTRPAPRPVDARPARWRRLANYSIPSLLNPLRPRAHAGTERGLGDSPALPRGVVPLPRARATAAPHVTPPVPAGHDADSRARREKHPSCRCPEKVSQHHTTTILATRERDMSSAWREKSSRLRLAALGHVPDRSRFPPNHARE